MKDLRGKVAVVTGAASGIGRALVDRFAAEGTRIVLADVQPLDAVVAELAGRGTEAVGFRTDVSRAADVEALAQKAVEAFGAVHIVCNNAGIGAGGTVWEHSLEAWDRVLGVNLWGVIHGCRTFLPLLLAQNEGHIVNTASMAGLTSNPFMAAYNVSKHGVVTLSETLWHELTLKQSAVKVSVVCPGWVRTNIAEKATGPMGELMRAQVAAGLAPEEVAHQVVSAIYDERFWVITHPTFLKAARIRMEDLLEQRNPTFKPW